MPSTVEASVVKVSLALGDAVTADAIGVSKIFGTLGGNVAVGCGEGVAVTTGMGVQVGRLVGLGVKVAVGSRRLGTSMTTGVGVAAVAIAVGVGALER